ncbi:Peptidase S41 family protein [Prunus dulcis]|uniref:C-terminal processing peptidase n=1 Tax=Prunus dulcis TaxID=3755 RepID=A0A4Y1QL38_PRUDU|nr:Peptidase S41 family protein [Prunus dulcis]
MEVLASSATASSCPHFVISNLYKNPNSASMATTPQVLQWKYASVRIVEARAKVPLMCLKITSLKRPITYVRYSKLKKKLRLKKYAGSLHKVISCSQKIGRHAFVRFVVGLMVVMSVSVSVSALTEENLLFLEAWRMIDRAYVDKSFNGQSWFRYRENALRNEPMNTREETYMAIKKMLATLEDPFTRFLEPEKLKSLRSGTQGALTGIGLSIGYPTKFDGSPAGLVVISASPEVQQTGLASCLGMLFWQLMIQVQKQWVYMMQQSGYRSSVKLTVRSGPEIKHLDLMREKVSLNPVTSRLCAVPASGEGSLRIGYIKLTSFNQNASGAVKEAINTLRSNNVNAFVLDLRDNRLDKGVIVYICDSRGVRDIYDTDGSKAVASSEPLAVLGALL